MNLKTKFAQYWERIQGSLFPYLEEELPPLTKKQQQLVAVLEVIRIEDFIPPADLFMPGRPESPRRPIARAFIAKAIYNFPTTRQLIDRLISDLPLRKICGWETRKEVPSESGFSRAFSEFADSDLLQKAHAELITSSFASEMVGSAIYDSSAIEAREKQGKKKDKKQLALEPVPLGRKRRPKGYKRELTRLQKQAQGVFSLNEMIDDLPSVCDVGSKTNSKGHLCWWRGYKLHMTASDNGIPLAALLTSASTNDSQATIPLAKITKQRVDNLYDVMDGGYYCEDIIEHSLSLGHIPIIDRPAKGNPKNKEEKEAELLACKTLNWKTATAKRYEIRTSVERVFSRLKDSFGARFVKVRGSKKVLSHLLFGILALTADQLLKIPLS